MFVKCGRLWSSARAATTPWPATSECSATCGPWKRPARWPPPLAGRRQKSGRTWGGYWPGGCSRYTRRQWDCQSSTRLAWDEPDYCLTGVWGAEMRGGGVSAGGALPGLLREPFCHRDEKPAAVGGSLPVPGLQNERNGPPDCQQALRLHGQLRFSRRHPGKCIKWANMLCFLCFFSSKQHRKPILLISKIICHGIQTTCL